MKLHFRAVLVAMLLVFIGAPVLASAADGGQIYTWVDKNGVRHYSDHPANPKATAVKELTTHPPGNAATAVSAAPVAVSPPHHAVPPGHASASTARKMTPEQRAALCAKLKDRIKRLESDRRVLVTQGDKKEYLSGQDLVDFRHMQEKKAQKVCKAP